VKDVGRHNALRVGNGEPPLPTLQLAAVQGVVARMERSAIRGHRSACRIPDFAFAPSGLRCYVHRGAKIVILLCAGDKRTQRQDIKRAQELAERQ